MPFFFRKKFNPPAQRFEYGALAKAIQSRDLQDVHFLLENGVNLNEKSPEGCTPLMMAIDKDQVDLVKALVEKGANLEETNADRNTALLVAAWNHKTECAEILVNRGAVLDFALVYAAEQCNARWNQEMKIIHMLLTKKVNVNEQGGNGMTPLMHAARNGHVPLTRSLLDKNVQFDITDNKGMTALDYAQKYDRSQIIYLINKAEGRAVIKAKETLKRDTSPALLQSLPAPKMLRIRK